VADNVSDGIVNTAFEGAASLDIEDSWLCSEQMQHRWSGSTDCREFPSIVQYTTTEKTDANVIQGRGSKL